MKKMIKEIFAFFTVVGIVMTLFYSKYPKIAAIDVPIGLLGLLGLYYLV